MLKVEAVINDFLEQILTFLFIKRPPVHCCSLNMLLGKIFQNILESNLKRILF